MDNVIVRPADPGESAAVAGLRWQWIVENEGAAAAGAERDAFVRHFVTWAEQNAASHRCMVLVDGDVGGDLGIIGMAWLAVVQRVPTPYALHRASGDLQCVYVVPEARDAGLGGRLITETLARAKDLGLERVTVHSTPRAIPAYARHGFENSPRLLQAHVARATRYP
ncbi:acetyltransferase [Streptomyces viridochromogenes]|uniref:Acetyltransferase n=1 Tax=Streptomyces viridochromogenes TaxID=1938 RepID=A0A0J7ZBC7_STRVR|nr:GNAT family N-acetyltransferase [Streptomyces viridochromogenes]KMS72478.1 acetyltransferase [Streptomyces viridochromogenes]KOG17579.1 acetyltransferase [Streptomyces viridochromogenes]KOG25777.1 acetyltransferase [Streptomyces viridochromogenes]